MSVFVSAEQAVWACWNNPLRSGLSALAMMTAVATIVVVVTALDGAEQLALQTGEKTFGSDTFVVTRLVSGQLSRRELAEKQERNPVLRKQDLEFLEEYSRGKVIYSGVVASRADISFGGRKFEGASLNGVDATMFQIRDLGMAEGRFFGKSEADRASQVVVLGADVADELFAALDPLQKIVRIRGRGFRVVGIQARQGTGGGVSLDRYAWIPRRAFERILGSNSDFQVFARALGTGTASGAEDHATISMRARRKLKPGFDDNFDLITPEAARSFVLTLSSRVSAAALPISLMALLAAVVVVTNTVLVSVSQRIQEIGIRRAMGATRSQILNEILFESALIGLVGGVVGLGVAWGLVWVAGQLAGLEISLQGRTAAVSLLAALLSGIAAGWYPAKWASRVDVIRAIRLE